MELWQSILSTVLSGALGCLVSLIVTALWNRPSKLKKERQKQINDIATEIKKTVDDVRHEASQQSDACKKDHECLAKIVGSIQRTNMAQNNGLVAVLRDLLKIRYLSWIEKGYAPMDSRSDLESMYQAYHGLGGNSVITELRERFLKLPIDKPEDAEDEHKGD